MLRFLGLCPPTGLAIIIVIIASSAVAPARAERFHVSIGGLRTSGPSTADVWDAANAYATLAGAFAQAAPADTVLLDDQVHLLDSAQTLSALLTNRDLAAAIGTAAILVGPGGSLQVDGGWPATEIRGLDIDGGAADRVGAAVVVANPGGTVSRVTLRACHFHDLHAAVEASGGGSALRAVSPGLGATIEVLDCVFSANLTRGFGGALWVGGGYQVALRTSSFTANAAVQGGLGGALALASSSALSTLLAEDCTFGGNTAGGPGGALNVDGASVVMRRCQVFGSRSAFEADAWWKEGAGLRVTRSGGHTDPVTVLLEDCEFWDNQGSPSENNNAGDGGAVLVKGGDLTRMVTVEATRCLFHDNTNAQGAGIYIGRFCEGTVSHCRFDDNIAWYQGGGAFKGGELPECTGELATFAYCEFRGNRAGFRPDGTETGEYSRGGGLMVRHNPRADVLNCTFVNNVVNTFPYRVGDGFAHALEGGVWQPENQCTLVNCAFWGDGNDVQVRSEGSGGMALVSHVAVSANELVVPGVVPEGTVLLAQLPFVSVLDLYPLGDSPLIDVGVPVAYVTDLAGLSVPFGAGYDIGCFEFHSLLGVDGPPAAAARLTVSPNPFNPRTTLAFALAESGPVRVAIHDARGRLVRELWTGELPAGEQALAWDGRDDRGRDVAAGVYLARLQLHGRDSGRVKLSLVR
jgi:hypothetical protein